MSAVSRLNFEAIGTEWVIDIFGTRPFDKDLLRKKIDKETVKFSKIFSRFDKDSEVTRVSVSGGEIIIPINYIPLINLYKQIYKLSSGLFTPLVGNILEDSGYDKNYSLVSKEMHPVLSWEETIGFDGRVLKIKRPALLDFGAGGKGFLVDLIGDLLEKFGVRSYCIDGGGDILYRNNIDKIIKIGLENPENMKQVIGVADLKKGSICGSAGNRRKWGKYHHIFNPETLDSVKNILAVWVIAENALLADCLSTCLFLVPPGKLRKEFNFEFLLLKPDMTIERSGDFPGEIFYN